jgi:hypothetical protein
MTKKLSLLALATVLAGSNASAMVSSPVHMPGAGKFALEVGHYTISGHDAEGDMDIMNNNWETVMKLRYGITDNLTFRIGDMYNHTLLIPTPNGPSIESGDLATAIAGGGLGGATDVFSDPFIGVSYRALNNNGLTVDVEGDLMLGMSEFETVEDAHNINLDAKVGYETGNFAIAGKLGILYSMGFDAETVEVDSRMDYYLTISTLYKATADFSLGFDLGYYQVGEQDVSESGVDVGEMYEDRDANINIGLSGNFKVAENAELSGILTYGLETETDDVENNDDFLALGLKVGVEF